MRGDSARYCRIYPIVLKINSQQMATPMSTKAAGKFLDKSLTHNELIMLIRNVGKHQGAHKRFVTHHIYEPSSRPRNLGLPVRAPTVPKSVLPLRMFRSMPSLCRYFLLNLDLHPDLHMRVSLGPPEAEPWIGAACTSWRASPTGPTPHRRTRRLLGPFCPPQRSSCPSSLGRSRVLSEYTGCDKGSGGHCRKTGPEGSPSLSLRSFLGATETV